MLTFHRKRTLVRVCPLSAAGARWPAALLTSDESSLRDVDESLLRAVANLIAPSAAELATGVDAALIDAFYARVIQVGRAGVAAMIA